jgi:hypothetical protein
MKKTTILNLFQKFHCCCLELSILLLFIAHTSNTKFYLFDQWITVFQIDSFDQNFKLDSEECRNIYRISEETRLEVKTDLKMLSPKTLFRILHLKDPYHQYARTSSQLLLQVQAIKTNKIQVKILVIIPILKERI